MNKKYKMSFTLGGLYYIESVKIAEVFMKLKDWGKVKVNIQDDNVLQTRTQNSSKRISSEICGRLKTLSVDEMNLLVKGSSIEQKHILWIAICKHYSFIFEFAVEVLREKYLMMDLSLLSEDFDYFFNSKAEWYEELENLSDTTKYRVKNVVLKMLKEAELVCDNVINPVIISNEFIKTLSRESQKYLEAFPGPIDLKVLEK